MTQRNLQPADDSRGKSPSGRELLAPLQLQLLALTVQEKTGREIADLYYRDTKRHISYGTLYTTLRRLREDGFLTIRDAEDVDGRLRYFKIDAAGVKALNQSRQYYDEIANFGRELEKKTRPSEG